jgi:putative transposase
MAARDSVDVAGALREQLESASPDLLRVMVKTFADALMSAEANAICGAPYGQRSDERTNQRNGYRPREWDIRAGTIELAIPKLRQGSYFPDWLLTHRRRAEQALVSVVATSYLLGVSTRRVEKLSSSSGVASLSKAQVSEMASYLDAQVEAFRNRPLDGGPSGPVSDKPCSLASRTSSAAACSSADGPGFLLRGVTWFSVAVITAPSSPGTKPRG